MRVFHDPSNSKTVYASSPDHIYKSYDGGVTWDLSDGGTTTFRFIDSLAFDPANPSTLYAGGMGDGVYKTSDGGATWSPVSTPIPNPEVRALAVFPGNPSTLYGATSDGLFKSGSGGLDWPAVDRGLAPARVNAIAFGGGDPRIIYIGTGGGEIYESSDAGGTWTAGDLSAFKSALVGIGPFPALSISGDPGQPATVYAGTQALLAKSTDAGATWFRAVPPPPPEDVNADGPTQTYCFLAEPSGTLLAGTIEGVFSSTDGGTSWVTSNTGLRSSAPKYPYDIGTNIYSLVMDPADPNTIYKGQGLPIPVYKSTNGGASWFKSSVGLPQSQQVSQVD